MGVAGLKFGRGQEVEVFHDTEIKPLTCEYADRESADNEIPLY
jgi:hypothetical protein